MVQKPYNFELQNPKVLVILRWVHFEIQNSNLTFWKLCSYYIYAKILITNSCPLYLDFLYKLVQNIVHNTYHTICILSESLEREYGVIWLYYNITNVFLWNNNTLIVRNKQRTGKLLEGDHIIHYDMDCKVYLMKKCSMYYPAICLQT